MLLVMYWDNKTFIDLSLGQQGYVWSLNQNVAKNFGPWVRRNPYVALNPSQLT